MLEDVIENKNAVTETDHYCSRHHLKLGRKSSDNQGQSTLLLSLIETRKPQKRQFYSVHISLKSNIFITQNSLGLF